MIQPPTVIQLSCYDRDSGKRSGRVFHVVAAHMVHWYEGTTYHQGAHPSFTRVFLINGDSIDVSETPEQVTSMFLGLAIEDSGSAWGKVA